MEPVFSIGINTRKKKKSKIKKQSKIKKESKIKIKKHCADTFYIYDGYRWQIPLHLTVNNSVKAKFSTLETVRSLSDIKYRIQENIRSMKFRFDVWSEISWKPPKCILSAGQSYYARQEHEWNKVKGIYFRIFYLRKVFKPLILTWRIKKAIKNVKNIEDPGTLEIPKKPVYIVDVKEGISFVYEARTLKRAIEAKILYSDYMFPEPRKPVNMLTNKPFTYGQLLSVLKQCRDYGETSWIIDGLWKHDAELSMFSIFHKQQIKIEAIKAHFKKSTYAIRDEVIDYFIQEAEIAEIPDDRQTRFINAYDYKPSSTLVQQWVDTTKDYYIAKELNDLGFTLRSQKRTTGLINSIYYGYA